MRLGWGKEHAEVRLGRTGLQRQTGVHGASLDSSFCYARLPLMLREEKAQSGLSGSKFVLHGASWAGREGTCSFQSACF